MIATVMVAASFAGEAKAQYVGVNVSGNGVSVYGQRIGRFLFPRIALARLGAFGVNGMNMGCSTPSFVMAPHVMQQASFVQPTQDRFGDVQDLLALRDLFEDEDEDDLEKETAEIVKELIKARLQEADKTDRAIEDQILGELRSALESIDERLQALEAHTHEGGATTQ